MEGERREATQNDLGALQRRLEKRCDEFRRRALQDGRGMESLIDASISATLAVVAREIRAISRSASTGDRHD